MNITKYLLPASLAATMHVALLWLMPEEPYVRVIAVPLKPAKPDTPPDLPVPPEETPTPVAAHEPVQPLAGKPAPPTNDEPPLTRLPENIFVIETDRRPRTFAPVTEIPRIIGPEVGREDGPSLERAAYLTADLLDRVPRAKVQVPPDYPAAMRHTGSAGSVLVEFDVDPTGRVVRAEAVRYSDREFAEPAVRAVKKWRFEPGRVKGRAVPFRMVVPIEFGIEPN